MIDTNTRDEVAIENIYLSKRQNFHHSYCNGRYLVDLNKGINGLALLNNDLGLVINHSTASNDYHRLATRGVESSSSSSCGERETEIALEEGLSNIVNDCNESDHEDANCNLIQEAMASQRIGDYRYSMFSQFNMCYDEPRTLILQMSGMLKQRRDYLTEHGMAEEPVMLHFLVTIASTSNNRKRNHVASLFLVNDLKDPKKLVAHVQVPSSDYAAEIVGKGGEKIKAMRHEFGVYIKSPARTETPSLFMLSGACENVVSCIAHLTKCIEHFYQIRRMGPPPPKSMESAFSLTDPIDSPFAAPRFRTERRAPELPPTNMTYSSGSSHSSNDSNTVNNMSMVNGLSSTQYPGLPAKRTATLHVEKDLVGLLVGPHGATILSIKSKVNEYTAALGTTNPFGNNTSSLIQTDIMTPKMGADSCFTITGSAEQIKLAKEVMCVYIVERDPSRAWPDQSVFYTPEAKIIVEAIIEEQKQRERNGCSAATAAAVKSRNDSGGSMGSLQNPLLPRMIGQLNGIQRTSTLVGLNSGGITTSNCMDNNGMHLNLQSILSKNFPLRGCSGNSNSELLDRREPILAGLTDSFTPDCISSLAWSNWNNYNSHHANMQQTDTGSLNLVIGGIDTAVNLANTVSSNNSTLQKVSPPNVTSSYIAASKADIQTDSSSFMYNLSLNRKPLCAQLSTQKSALSSVDTWSVTAADTWASTTPHEIRKITVPEVNHGSAFLNNVSWNPICLSNEETPRRSCQQDEFELQHFSGESMSHFGTQSTDQLDSFQQQQNGHLPMAARAPGHGRPANQSPILGQSRLMGLGNSNSSAIDFHMFSSHMRSGEAPCR